jgi:DNA polymerase-3 subunit delta
MSTHGFSFLVCPDPALVGMHIDRLLSGDTRRRVAYWGDTSLPPSFWRDLSSPGLMGGDKALVLRRAHLLDAATWAELSAVLGSALPGVWPFLCLEGEWKGRKPAVPAAVSRLKCWKLAQKKGWVWQSPGLDSKGLRTMVRDWAGGLGVNAAPRVLDALCSLLPEDAAGVAGELEKLALALDGADTLLMEHLNVVAHGAQMDFYEFVNALQQGRTDASVWKQVLTDHRAAANDRMLFRLLAHLRREAGQMWMLAQGEGDKVRLPGFVKQRKEDLARRVGRRRLCGIWDLVLDAELGVKSGERGEDQALEHLVAGLAELFAPRGRRGT